MKSKNDKFLDHGSQRSQKTHKTLAQREGVERSLFKLSEDLQLKFAGDYEFFQCASKSIRHDEIFEVMIHGVVPLLNDFSVYVLGFYEKCEEIR
jgi:hypothetical protein